MVNRVFAVFCFLAVLAIASGRPLAADVIIAGSLTHERISEPGEAYKGSITVNNEEDNPQEIKVYQNDYHFDAAGLRDYGDPGTLKRSNAPWITFSPKRTTVPPKGTITINYTIAVPDDKTMTGSYWSVIMVEGIPEESAESAAAARKADISIGMVQTLRYAIQMVTHIGDTGARTLKFIGSRVVREADKQSLEVDIENTGERWLKALLSIELYDEKGGFVGKFEGGAFRLYPGTSRRYTIDLSTVSKKKKYKVLAVVDCGENFVFGANLNLTL